MRMTIAGGVAAAILVSGCAQQPDQVTKSYVSPSTYAHLNCQQLLAERAELVGHVSTLTAKQKQLDLSPILSSLFPFSFFFCSYCSYGWASHHITHRYDVL